MSFDYRDLVFLFDQCFYTEFNTRLVAGKDEPVYIPACSEIAHHRIVFAHGFFRSALHEVAHWLVAGEARRLQEDYGYWYEPDGRSSEQQALFEKVEVKPQAIEWLLTKACGHSFCVSVDNLSGEETDPSSFKQAVFECAKQLQHSGLNERADRFYRALARHYDQPKDIKMLNLMHSEL